MPSESPRPLSPPTGAMHKIHHALEITDRPSFSPRITHHFEGTSVEDNSERTVNNTDLHTGRTPGRHLVGFRWEFCTEPLTWLLHLGTWLLQHQFETAHAKHRVALLHRSTARVILLKKKPPQARAGVRRSVSSQYCSAAPRAAPTRLAEETTTLRAGASVEICLT